MTVEYRVRYWAWSNISFHNEYDEWERWDGPEATPAEVVSALSDGKVEMPDGLVMALSRCGFEWWVEAREVTAEGSGAVDAGRRGVLVSDDRTVHATLPSGDLIVRRDRAGKWYHESEGHLFPISFREAVLQAQLPGAVVHTGLPGGKLFDAAVAGRA